MDHRSEKASTFFTRLAYSLVRKRRLAVVPLSKSLRSPGPQTSLSMSYRTDSFDYALTRPTPFRSLRAPKRTHPFNSLPHLTRPTAHRPLRTVPRSIWYYDRRLP